MFEDLFDHFGGRRKQSRTAQTRTAPLLVEELEPRLVPSIPRPDHVVLVMEENHAENQVIGTTKAPYINNTLVPEGAFMTNSFAIEHPSLPNYLDIFSGSNQGITTDVFPVPGAPFSAPSLGGEVLKAGFTFDTYAESLPSVGSTAGWSPYPYDHDHAPWNCFKDDPASTQLPFQGYWPTDYTKLPAVSIVSPNLLNDMHDGTIAQGDTWLQQNIDSYAQWAKANNSLLIVTWDEDDGSQNNQVATIFVGQMVVPGRYNELIDHFSILRTIEDMYGLTYAGASASATSISDIWSTTGTPPATPSNLTATAASSSEIDLAWSESSTSVTQFKIERSSDNVNFTQITTVAGGVTTYKDMGLTANATYYYRVRANNSAGDSGYSNVASAITSGVPAAPSNLTATAVSTSEIDLAWSESSTNVTQFKIERSTDNVNFTQITTATAGVTTYKDTGLTASTTYYYRVRANNAAGDSGYSNVASDITAVPAAPSNLTAAAVSTSEIDLAWSESSSNVAQFKIERSTDGVNFTQITTVAAGVTSYKDTGLAASTTYSYRVRASNTVGNSAYSNVASDITAVPAAPTKLTATAVSTSEIDLAWSESSTNVTKFKIERSTDNVNFTQLTTVATGVTTYKSTGLSANTTYYYRVRASNTLGNSGYSNVASDITSVPAAPTKLTAAAVSTSEIDLAWSESSTNVAQLKIERSTDNVNFTQITTVAAGVITYKNTGLTASTTYYYRVRASNTVGDSGYSNVASDSTSVPAAPSNLTATAVSGSEIDLAWSESSSSVTQFKIERSTDGVNFTQITTVAAGVTAYKDTGLTANVSYSYRVLASNQVGDSAYSNVANATTSASLPAAPSNLTANAVSTSEIDLAWSESSTNVTLFKIERSTDNVNYAQLTTVTAGATSYQDTGLTANTTYYYRVRANNATGDSPYSNVASATTSASLPAAPSNLTATAVSVSEIDLAWSESSTNVTQFKIERSTDNVNFTQITTVAAGVTTYKDTGLTVNTTYYYRVRANNAAGDSGYSNVASDSTSVPAAPSKLTAAAVSTSEIDLAWNESSSNVTQFKIERSTDNVNFTQITTVAAAVTTYKNTGLTAGTTYYFRVRASNTAGDSGYSNVASDITSAPAAPGSLTAAEASTSEIDLAWSESSTNVTKFKIERSTDNVNFTQITTVAAGVTTYNDTGLTANTTYYYRVRASNTVGNSAYSNVANATTSAALPAAPSNLTASAMSTSQINLTWSDNSNNETAFVIERSSNGTTFTQIATVVTDITSYSDTGLTIGSQYSYRVKASNTAGSSAFSTVANTSTLHGTPNQRFVFQVYQDLLGRRVDAPALVSWTNVLNTGTSRGQMVEMIESSVEYRTDEVESLYQEFLGRPVDSASLQSWVTFLGAGGTSKQMTAMILGSEEFFINEGSGTVKGFLSTLYQDVLNRAIDATASQTWSQDLANGISRSAVALAVLRSLESDKDEVQTYYTRYLHRAADSAGLSTFETDLLGGMRNEDVIAAIVGSTEYYNNAPK